MGSQFKSFLMPSSASCADTCFSWLQKEWRNDWEQKLQGMRSPGRSRGCCGLAGLAQVQVFFAQGAQPCVLPAWEGWVPGNLCARPWCGAVQGAQPVPLAPEEQILEFVL